MNFDDLDIMNIYAEEGDKVVFAGKGGWENEPEDAIKEGLEIGKEYTVAYTDVHSYSSTVCLKEFPEQEFNTVMFVDAEKYNRAKAGQPTRDLVYPAFYRHFKDMNYLVKGKSYPISRKDFYSNINNMQIATYTEDPGVSINVRVDKDLNFNHCEDAYDGVLVLYQAMYGGMENYVRPYGMFMEEVPEGKENPTGQKYRLEQIKREEV